MEKTPVLPKHELLRIMQRFLDDPTRAISIAMFAQLAGLSTETIKEVFINEAYPMSEMVQIRVSKAYKAWLNGEVAVIRNPNGTKYVEYRKTPRQALKKELGLKLVDGKFKIKLGVRPKYDYSGLTLVEQIEGK